MGDFGERVGSKVGPCVLSRVPASTASENLRGIQVRDTPIFIPLSFLLFNKNLQNLPVYSPYILR